MKTVVLYRSKSGFTKKYAEWIASDLGADCRDCRKIKASSLPEYDVIVFGGGLHKGRINGIPVIARNLARLSGKRVIVFVTGGSLPRAGIEDEILAANFRGDERKLIRLFYYRGGMDFGKLGILDKILLIGKTRKLRKANEADLTENDRALLAAMGRSEDGTDRDMIGPLVAFARS